MPGIIDLPKFNNEDWEEIVTVRSPSDWLLSQSDRVHLEFMGNASRYIITKFAVEGNSPPHELQIILGNLSELVTQPKKNA